MRGECADCKWWERRQGDQPSWGWCRDLTDIKGDVGVTLIRGGYGAGGIFGEKVFTAEDFGCNQFEPRDAGGDDVA